MIIVTILLVVIVIIVLLIVLSKWWVGSSAKARQVTLICLLLVSLAANVSLLVHSLVSESFVGGDGQYGVSPNDLYTAHAFSLGPFFGTQPGQYRLYIESRTGQRLKTAHIYTGETNAQVDFRQLPQIIHWSADSKEVEFRIPGIQLSLAVENVGATAEEK
jgi:hypothetical protein